MSQKIVLNTRVDESVAAQIKELRTMYQQATMAQFPKTKYKIPMVSSSSIVRWAVDLGIVEAKRRLALTKTRRSK